MQTGSFTCTQGSAAANKWIHIPLTLAFLGQAYGADKNVFSSDIYAIVESETTLLKCIGIDVKEAPHRELKLFSWVQQGQV